MSIIKNERGMVLLMVLLVVALLATILTELSFSTLVDMRMAETFRDTTRSSYLSRGGLVVGRALLQDDTNNYDSTDELWAIGVQQYPVADGSVSIDITDLEGRINLNGLVTLYGNDPIIMERYRRLLVELGVNRPDLLIDTLIDWIDTFPTPMPQGAENAHYLSLSDPYQCKNGPLDTIEELAMVEGYSPELLEKLRPYVTAYGSKIVNVNTASREVLLALSSSMDDTIVETLMTARQAKPFTALSQVKDLPGMDALSNSIWSSISSYIDVKSAHFQIESTGWVNDGRMTLQTVVDKGNDKILFQRVL